MDKKNNQNDNPKNKKNIRTKRNRYKKRKKMPIKNILKDKRVLHLMSKLQVKKKSMKKKF